MTNGSLMKVKSIAKCSKVVAFCNAFDLYQAKICLEKQFLAFLRVAVLHRFYCKQPICYKFFKDNTVNIGQFSKFAMKFNKKKNLD